MFGHQTNNDTNDQANAVQHGSAVLADSMYGPSTVAPTAASAPIIDAGVGGYAITDLPGTTPSVDALASTPTTPNITVVPAPADNPHRQSVIPGPVLSSTNSSPNSNSGLLDLKQQALHELSPLIGHLEQTPEEKFRTTMMMIQASDDNTMLHSAYEAAKAITDEKVRAQALLDVVNEINYFTQQQSDAN